MKTVMLGNSVHPDSIVLHYLHSSVCCQCIHRK